MTYSEDTTLEKARESYLVIHEIIRNSAFLLAVVAVDRSLPVRVLLGHGVFLHPPVVVAEESLGVHDGFLAHGADVVPLRGSGLTTPPSGTP